VTAVVSFLSLSVPDNQQNKFTLCVHIWRLEMITLKVQFDYDQPLKYDLPYFSIDNARVIYTKNV